MATKKIKLEKTTTNTNKESTPTKKGVSVKLDNGEDVTLKDGDIVKMKDDGTVEFVDKSCLIRAEGIVININFDNELMSYPIIIKKCDNGNILFRFATANGIDSVKKEMKPVNCLDGKNGVCFIGRGRNMEAMFAAQNCWEGYARNFGIDKAYALVRLELESESKEWCALFVPVLKVIGC